MSEIIEYGPKLKISEEIHSVKYRAQGETFRESQSRVANTLADDPEHFYAFRDILLPQRFLPAGRVQSSVGSPRKTTAFNCFVAGTIDDSMDGIMDAAKDAAQTMRLGGGIGYDFSTLRPKGDKIITLDSKASGVISFMEIFDAICKTVSSAGNRRGAQMGVLRVDHPDIEEFIEAKTNQTELTKFNISIGVTDEFMEAVTKGTDFELKFKGEVYKRVDAQYLWDKIMRATWDWAEPGILFIDRINNYNNLWYCETIAATNPCLHPDSLIETVDGRVRIADITEPTQVYSMDDDGKLCIKNASSSWVSKRGAETLNITTGNGKQIRVTKDHKVAVHGDGFIKWIEAAKIERGDRLVQLCRSRRGAAYSGVKLTTEDNRAYRMEHVMIADAVYGVAEGEDVHHIDGNTYNNSIDNLEVLSHSDHSTYTATNDNPQDHQEHGEDGKFVSTGRSKKTIIPMPDELRSKMKNNHGSTVMSITPGDVVDVYDMTVEDTHNFVADFTVVHNCGEQPLPPYGACLLGSFNLVKYLVEEKKGYGFDFDQFLEDIPTVVRAMDNIIDRTVYPLPQQEEEAKAKRRMGLGITGLANAGEALGMVYGDKKFLRFEEKVLKILANESYKASALLAKEKGTFPLYDERYLEGKFIQQLDDDVQELIKKSGTRNSHLTSIAPTGTISLSADNISSGIEPTFSHKYDRTIQTEDGPIVEEVTDYAYRELGVVGKTADECTIDEHLGALVVASKWVDSAVSKTMNVGEDVSWDDFKSIYIQAWKKGCKGCTTFRSAGERYGILNKKEAEAGDACYINQETGQKECS